MSFIISAIETADAWILHGPLARMFDGLLDPSMDLSRGPLLEVRIITDVVLFCLISDVSVFWRLLYSRGKDEKFDYPETQGPISPSSLALTPTHIQRTMNSSLSFVFYVHLYSIRQENYSRCTPLVVILVLLSSAAIVRSGTRCTIAAVATCAAVLTCFATLIVNQSYYAPELHIYRKTATVVTLP